MTSVKVLTTVHLTIALFALQLRAGNAASDIEVITKKLTSVKSYTVALDLHVAIPFIEAPPSKATMYYKAPNKSTIKAEGFAMIPQQTSNASLAQLFTMPHTTVDAGYESFRGIRMRKVTLIPTSDTSPIAVATVLIDTASMLPMKIVATAKIGGTATTELAYNDQAARVYGLPSYMKFIVELNPLELPRTMTGDFDRKKSDTPPKMIKGTIQIWYTGYKFNVPIADSVFTD